MIRANWYCLKEQDLLLVLLRKAQLVLIRVDYLPESKADIVVTGIRLKMYPG